MTENTQAIAELPWHVRHDEDGMTHEICSAANWQVAVIKGVGTLAGDACDKANAAYIVKCVNEHEAYERIAAAARAIARIDAGLDGWHEDAKPQAMMELTMAFNHLAKTREAL